MLDVHTTPHFPHFTTTFQIRRKYKTLNSIVITSTTPNEITRPWLPIFADCKLRSRLRYRLRVSAGMLLRESLIPGVGRWRCWWGWHAWLAEYASPDARLPSDATKFLRSRSASAAVMIFLFTRGRCDTLKLIFTGLCASGNAGIIVRFTGHDKARCKNAEGPFSKRNALVASTNLRCFTFTG